MSQPPGEIVVMSLSAGSKGRLTAFHPTGMSEPFWVVRTAAVI
jgi:hypothetical protein